MDIAIDPLTGDMALGSDGDAVTVRGRDAIVQHIRVRLQFVLGEWVLDAREGLPYFEQIWVIDPDMPAIEELYRRTIRETPGVASVRSFRLGHDAQTRTLSILECDAVTTDGETITPDDFRPFVVAS